MKKEDLEIGHTYEAVISVHRDRLFLQHLIISFRVNACLNFGEA